jgi:hypothetical protein
VLRKTTRDGTQES